MFLLKVTRITEESLFYDTIDKKNKRKTKE